MAFIGIWLALLALFFVLPLLWLVPRWGAPYPSAYRRRRGGRYSRTDISDADVGVDAAHERDARERAAADPWWYWADVLWLVLLVMLVWLVLAVWAG